MIVVSDTSPLNYLILIEAVAILPTLFNRVLAPPSVIGELLHPSAPPPVRAWAASTPTWLEVIAPSSNELLPDLDEGEADAINLARELGADAILIDERSGHAADRKLGLRVTGTIGILELASRRKLLDLQEMIERIRRTNFRCSAGILDAVLSRDSRRRRRQ